MSTVLPTRRTTRTTRTAAKDNENANARPARSVRAKPSSAVSSIAPAAGPVRAVAPTAASRAKNSVALSVIDGEAHAGKRKREALGDVTVHNRVKATKGKDKAGEKPVAQKVLRPVGGTRTTRHTTTNTVIATDSELHQVKEETEEVLEAPIDDNAMAVDPQIPSLRRSLKKTERTTIHIPDPKARRSLEEDPDDGPAFKKRRTSSEAPPEDSDLLEEQRLRDEEAEIEERLNAEMDAYADEPECDPQNSHWTDLDLEDADDPAMVSEYVVEIFGYLKQLEQTTMPNPTYMHNQKELAWKMRGILSDWLIDVHARFRLLPETLFLALNLIDRFLSARVVSLAKLQLVGITCLFIAAKTEEIIVPSLDFFVRSAESTYTEEDMRKAERYILQITDWNMSYPSPVHFLRRISKADEYNVPVRTLAKYLLEIALVEWRLIATPPSLLAAAAMWLSRLVQGYDVWTPNLAHYSSYSESQLIPTANLMINYLLKPIEHKSFFKKYGGRRYNKSSNFMYQWTRDRWHECTKVDLPAELPRLKAHIRLERAAEDAREAERERTFRVEDTKSLRR